MACCRNTFCLITIATLIGPFVEVFLVISFATEHWLESDVDRSVLTVDERQISATNSDLGRVYFSRDRGIIRECYKAAGATFLDTDGDVVDDNCFHIDFDLPSGSHSSNEKSRIHLNRSILALFIVALVLVVATFILGVALCCHRNFQIGVAAGVTSIFASIFVLLGIVLFHVLRYLETNKDGQPGEFAFENNWSQKLKDATSSDLGYSYAFAWVAFGLAAIDGVFYLCAARAIQTDRFMEHYHNDRQRIHKNSPRTGKGREFSETHTPYDNQVVPVSAMTASPMFFPGYVSTMPDHNIVPVSNEGFVASNTEGVFFKPADASNYYQ